MKSIFWLLLLTASVSQAQTKKPATNAATKKAGPAVATKMSPIDSLSYSIGVQVAQYYKTQGVEKINGD